MSGTFGFSTLRPSLVATTTGIAFTLALVVAASAQGKLVTKTMRWGPIRAGNYEVVSDTVRTPAPRLAGSIVEMHARMVDSAGRPMSPQRLMLHHVVFLNLGARTGDRHDGSCPELPRERFYGNGEEDEALQLPPGYGYPVGARDRWRMSWMVMNHRNRQEKGWIEYTVTVDDDPTLSPVKPFWLDVAGCGKGSIFSVPGGEGPGAVQDQSIPWIPPRDGRIVAMGSHLHGGALAMRVTEPDCGDRTLAESRPTYGMPDNIYYRIRPILHEPGPISTSWFESQSGVPIHRGERLTVHGEYEAEHPHARVMAIAHAYVAFGGAPVPEGCAPLPDDITAITTSTPGRTEPPFAPIPLTGLDSHGKAITIDRPPGKAKTVDGDVTVMVRDWAFSPPNLSVPAGATVTWRFDDKVRHGVTLASGPRGFASLNLRNGATYSQRLDVPGTYRLLCPLHPVTMTEAIDVRPAPG